MLGYAAHCVELFGSRSWVVAFLGFSSSLRAAATFAWNAPAIAAAVNFISVPASIVGNEIALRLGRRRWIVIAMTGSGTGCAAPRSAFIRSPVSAAGCSGRSSSALRSTPPEAQGASSPGWWPMPR